MRTTLTIDEDVFAAAKELATVEHKSVGQVISALARTALRPSAIHRPTRNGVPLLTVGPDTRRVTSDLVYLLQNELL